MTPLPSWASYTLVVFPPISKCVDFLWVDFTIVTMLRYVRRYSLLRSGPLTIRATVGRVWPDQSWVCLPSGVGNRGMFLRLQVQTEKNLKSVWVQEGKEEQKFPGWNSFSLEEAMWMKLNLPAQGVRWAQKNFNLSLTDIHSFSSVLLYSSVRHLRKSQPVFIVQGNWEFLNLGFWLLGEYSRIIGIAPEC